LFLYEPQSVYRSREFPKGRLVSNSTIRIRQTVGGRMIPTGLTALYLSAPRRADLATGFRIRHPSSSPQFTRSTGWGRMQQKGPAG
jgi:hypothetical protein